MRLVRLDLGGEVPGLPGCCVALRTVEGLLVNERQERRARAVLIIATSFLFATLALMTLIAVVYFVEAVF